MPDTTQKVCLITGGSAGIGLATAKRFAEQGYRVSICGRRPDALKAAAESIGKLTGESSSVFSTVGDVADPTTTANLVARTLDHFGRIDVLVNNAGVAPLNEIESIDDETFNMVTDVNMSAVFRLTRAVWPIMKSNGGGCVVNISSLAAIDPFPGFSVYGASKAWVEIFSKAIAAEGQELGIRVCCVRPGAVETDLLRGLFPDFPGDQCVSPDDIAAKIWDCVADPAEHPSGEAFTVSK